MYKPDGGARSASVDARRTSAFAPLSTSHPLTAAELPGTDVNYKMGLTLEQDPLVYAAGTEYLIPGPRGNLYDVPDDPEVRGGSGAAPRPLFPPPDGQSRGDKLISLEHRKPRRRRRWRVSACMAVPGIVSDPLSFPAGAPRTRGAGEEARADSAGGERSGPDARAAGAFAGAAGGGSGGGRHRDARFTLHADGWDSASVVCQHPIFRVMGVGYTPQASDACRFSPSALLRLSSARRALSLKQLRRRLRPRLLPPRQQGPAPRPPAQRRRSRRRMTTMRRAAAPGTGRKH